MQLNRVFLLVLATLAALLASVSAQSFGDFFPGFGGPLSQAVAATPGGRTNTGPILFPNSPAGSESSGVVVGASGFGFVPPGGRAGGPRGVYPSLNSLVPSLGPSLGSSLGPSLRPSVGPTSLRPSLGVPAGPSLRLPGGLGVGGLSGPTRLRPSVSYSTTHPSSLGSGPLLGHSSIWRLPARSSTFFSGPSSSFSSSSGGAFSNDDFL